ncbi:MAG: hypothetical protein MK207_02470 [Saprospiraceae bacterium]|nr:hypothetical protein [Saprospiraceae bacterium]
MKKIVPIPIITLLTIAFFSCNKNSNCVSSPLGQNQICIDTSLISNIDTCIEIYEPVCGCDDNTYDNYCIAEQSGVISYIAGKCCE